MTDRELEKTLHQLHLEDAQTLSDSMPILDDAAKKRIMAQCNDKMNLTSVRTDGAEVSGVGQLTWVQRYRPVLTAAACILMVCGIGAAIALHGRVPDSSPVTPITQIPTIAETAVSATEDVTETTQTCETAETTTTIISTVQTTAQTSVQTSVVTETSIMTDTQPETVTETSQEICSVPLQEETLTFRTQTIEEPYPDHTDTNRIALAYPQADGTSAEAESINALIQERVQAMRNYAQNAADALREEALQYGNDDLYQNASCSLHVSDYEITRNDADYLSVVWRGDYYLYSAAHPNCFAQGLVIDKKTMTTVSLSDLYNVNAEMITEELIARSPAAFAEKFGGSASDYADFAVVTYQESLLTAGENIIDGHMFALTDSGIIVDGFVTHSIGDYVEIHIPFETIESFRK